MDIDITRDPPTAEEIDIARQGCGMSAAEKTLWFCPIPGLDLLAALAVHAASGPPERDQLNYVHGGVDLDWSRSAAAQTYVNKVRALQRPLIQKEIAALQSRLKMCQSFDGVVGAGYDALGGVMGAAKDVVGGHLRSWWGKTSG